MADHRNCVFDKGRGVGLGVLDVDRIPGDQRHRMGCVATAHFFSLHASAGNAAGHTGICSATGRGTGLCRVLEHGDRLEIRTGSACRGKAAKEEPVDRATEGNFTYLGCS